jgi:glycosyltransferase involved in cell wall biosynthesis
LLEAFGVMQAKKFTFLFVFSMMSVMGRKNPIGLINAFRATFSLHENVQLIIKTSYGYRNSVMLNRLRDAARGANVVIIDDVYSDDMTLSLINACDAYISLHRSEGLGLTMAEAMLLGKPVIATRYSGNLDFMDDDNSLLVDFTEIKVGKECQPYMAEASWADPIEAHASQLMRRVFENQIWARQLGQQAQQDIQNNYSSRAAGQAMKMRLQAIAMQYRINSDTV